LEEASQRIISALAENCRLFESSIFEQTNTITQLHTEVKETTVKEHENTRSILLKAIREVDTNRKPSGTAKLDHPINQEQELETRRRAEDHTLRSLRIPSMSEHYNRIVEAHAATFQWIFKDPAAEDRPWSNFAQWLKDGEGIYWINGKAGSGKSTLMRYIYDHQQTRELLRAWCGEIPLIVASFFFWTSDATDLKPYNSLLRSLLHQLLSQHRDLIPVVLPDQWQDE
jgi:ATPase subunit of ABC transporter with duplicated ATPase domains